MAMDDKQEWSQRSEDIAEEAARKLRELGQQAQEKAGRFSAKGKTEAIRFRERAWNRADTQREKLGIKLEEAGRYVRVHDTNTIWWDVKTYVKRHPMQAALGGLLAGLLIGRSLR